MNLFSYIFGKCCIVCGKTVDPRSPEICRECSEKIEKNHLSIPLSEQKNAVSVYYYDEPIRRGMHQFKYGGKKALGIFLGHRLAERYRQRGDVAHLITCVPRAKDGRSRIYNQSAVIAKTVAKELNLPFDPNLLCKKKGALTQPECPTPLAREENAKKAYQIGTSSRELTGLRVLLVDDLYTTGATARACEARLKSRGAKDVLVYTGSYDRTHQAPKLIANFDRIHVHEDFSDASPYKNRTYRKKKSKT